MIRSRGTICFTSTSPRRSMRICTRAARCQPGPPRRPDTTVVSMLILKEGFGWNDAQLFEHCRFNILVMRALGMMNLCDEAPAESRYIVSSCIV